MKLLVGDRVTLIQDKGVYYDYLISKEFAGGGKCTSSTDITKLPYNNMDGDIVSIHEERAIVAFSWVILEGFKWPGYPVFWKVKVAFSVPLENLVKGI
jgi:hypothetical protein